MTEAELKKKRNSYIDKFQRARNSLKRLLELDEAIATDEDLPKLMKSELLGIIGDRTDVIYHFLVNQE